MTSPQERAEEAVARAFGRAPARPVTEADQEAARAFGRTPPALTEVTETASTPVAEMEALLQEYRQLCVSRRGDSEQVARNAAIAERAMMSEAAMQGRRLVRRVTQPSRLAQLRKRVEEMRDELPLSAGSPAIEEGGSPSGGREVTPAEAEEAAAAAFGRTGPASADDAVAAAFGRSTKGQA